VPKKGCNKYETSFRVRKAFPRRDFVHTASAAPMKDIILREVKKVPLFEEK